MSHPPATQSVAEMRTNTRLMLRPDVSHRLDDFETQPHPVLERSAVRVASSVCQRRQKLVNQVPVRGVYFDDVEAGLARARGGLLERAHDARDLRDVQRTRDRIVLRKRLGGRPDRLPAAVLWGHGALSGPGAPGAALAAGVRELHAGGAPCACTNRTIRRKRVDMRVLPDAEIFGADAPFGGDRGRLGEHQPGAADGPAPEMHEVPVVGEAIDARVLAHRRHDDAVGQA